MKSLRAAALQVCAKISPRRVVGGKNQFVGSDGRARQHPDGQI